MSRLFAALATFVLLVALAAPLLVPSTACAQPVDTGRAVSDIRFLASDELQGRRAGEPSAEVAARYIAEQFRAAGVQPVPDAEDGYFQTVTLRDSSRTSRNVVGWIPGSDPELTDEVVMLLAHYDHVGMGGQRATEADSIFNGARDNGMGTVAVIAAARSLAAAPPRRSVLLFTPTAEEQGLIGSRHFAENPLVPLDDIVFALNVDTGGYSDTTIVTVVGLDRTTAQSLIEAGAAAAGLEAVLDPSPEQNLFDRSDNVAFARKGIPAPTFSPGFRAFSDPGVANYYHQVTDEVDDLDMAYLARFVTGYVESARRIADAPDRPHWTPGDVYEAAGQALYGE